MRQSKFWTVNRIGTHELRVVRIGETEPWATATLMPGGWSVGPKGQRVAFWRLRLNETLCDTVQEINGIATWQAGRSLASQILLAICRREWVNV